MAIVNDSQGFAGEIRTLVLEGDVDPSRAVEILDNPQAPERQRLVDEQFYRNLVTNNGRAQMTKIILGESTSIALTIALSTSAIVPALGDTALTNEIYRQAVSVRQSFLIYYQRYVGVFTTVSFGSTGVVAEGLFDTATTGGIMWADASISVNKSTTQTLIVDHRIQATT